MGPHDRDIVCHFLEDAFRAVGIKAATWSRLFDHDWSDHGRGYVLLDDRAVVGFDGEAALVCNISSWAVHPKYPGWGMALLAEVLRDESLTYTAFTPNPTAWATLLAQRFTPLDSHRIVMPPMLQAGTLFAPDRPVINFDPVAVRERLTSQQQQIFDDHAPRDCQQLTVSEGSYYAYLVVKRRSHRLAASRLGGLTGVLPVRIPYSDILHCSTPELLSRHLERVKLAILRRQRTAALGAEARLLPVRPWGVLLGPKRTCYRSPLLAADDLDRLVFRDCALAHLRACQRTAALPSWKPVLLTGGATQIHGLLKSPTEFSVSRSKLASKNVRKKHFPGFEFRRHA